MGHAGQDDVQLEVLEGQLTWLVHIIAAVVRGKPSSSTAESQEIIDGELTARAFGLLQIVDSGYAAFAVTSRHKNGYFSHDPPFAQCSQHVFQ